ncbi:PucR family transcriptional regulator [Subtercola sp. YIM 133946]|uniref:PucR family transcriptional regulator n=1 Tax=Subtercola sp. YIM 133946 TaxID=3118909 RepID=UPI002F92AF72
MLAGTGSDDAVMDVPVNWVHSSDLQDPTPWLEPGQVLLTNGAQFAVNPAVASAPAATKSERDDFVVDYVRRLRETGVLALGFATGVVTDVVPDDLIAACDAARLPLFEVDPAIPFIAIIRFVADVIADDRRSRLEWSLEAQRAVARAALRADGLPAILLELSRRLGCWVGLYDSARTALTVPSLEPVPERLRGEVEAEVLATLARGARASVRVSDDGVGYTMQTLGQTSHLLGVLVVGTTTPFDPAENDLVGSVIGLASIALEQRRALDAARRRLRTGLFELLLSGVVDVADRTATSLWGPLPDEPVHVSVVAGTVSGQSLFDELELAAARHEGGMFYAERGDEILVVSRDPKELESVLRRHGLGAGCSAAVGWADLPRGLTEARRSARSVSREQPFVRFEHLAEQGLQGLLATSGGQLVAQRLLQPVLDLPEDERDMMLRTLRVWLWHNGAWDPAARELGVHRHTLRSRVRVADATLSTDLESFAARAELWSALQLLE